MINMILYWGENKEEAIKVLLDTGSSVPILADRIIKGYQIPVAQRPRNRPIQDFPGIDVDGAGEYFRSPLLLQYHKHFDRVSFEVAPLPKDYNAILPCWWLAKYKCDLQVEQPCHIKFDMNYCKKNCKTDRKFALEWDPSILADKDAGILGMVAAAPTEDDLQQAINRVPEAFRQLIPIMTTEAASNLPDHGAYDHAIHLQDGETPPWGPIYALNEVELEELRN